MKKVAVLFILALGVMWTLSASAEETYTVQRGDRLNEVAELFGVTQEELLAANPRTAYGVSCKNPHTVELRDGHMRAICGGDEPYLIAGKTLIVPESRLFIQSENVRLNSEIVALRAEMDKLRQERETEKSVLDTLRQERDRLAAANAKQAEANTEQGLANANLNGQCDEARYATERVLASYQKSQAELNDNTFVLLLVLGFALLVCFIVSYYHSPSRKIKRLAEQVRHDQDHLAAEQQAVVNDREEVLRQRREAEEKQHELEAGRAALEADRKTVEEGRLANEKLKGDLDTRDAGLRAAAGELDQRDQELRERNRALNGREAELFLAEEAVVDGERLLGQGRAALRQDWTAYHAAARQLAGREAEVDAKLRTAAEDLPALERVKGEVTKRVDAVKVREIDAARREKEATDREAAAKQREDEAARREEELRLKESAATDHDVVFAQRVKEVTAREEQLHRSEGELRTKQMEFNDEMTAARAAFEQKKAEARGLLTRAKRKAEIVRALDERKQALDDRERSLADREDRLKLAEQAMAAKATEAGDDDNPTAVVLPNLPGDEVDPSGTTHLTAPGSDPAAPAEICKAICDACGLEVPFDKLEEHRATAHGTAASRDTGPQVPVADQPSHEESGFYCTTCHRVVSAEEYAANHAAHDKKLPG